MQSLIVGLQRRRVPWRSFELCHLHIHASGRPKLRPSLMLAGREGC